MSDNINKQYLKDLIKSKLDNDKWVDINGSVSALEYVIEVIETEGEKENGYFIATSALEKYANMIVTDSEDRPYDVGQLARETLSEINRRKING